MIAITPRPQKCFYHTGKKQFSGNGRNRITTNIVDAIDVGAYIFPKKLQMNDTQGKNIELRSGAFIKDFWKKVHPYAKYGSSFTKGEQIDNPLFFIKGTSVAVGGLDIPYKDGGRILYIPDISDALYDESDETRSLIESAVLKLFEDLSEPETEELPHWANKYLLPGEEKRLRAISKIDEKIATLKGELAAEKSLLSELQEWKTLLTSRGDFLEKKIAVLLKELGAEVSCSGEFGRKDLLVTHGDNVAVVEVKGLKKSAAEKHAAQLEKWVSEYHAEKDRHPKGILIVNAFCETPLKNRVHEPFPEQMLFCESRKHCLLTSWQLLEIYFESKGKPDLALKYLDQIFATVGRFPKKTKLFKEALLSQSE